MLTSNLPTPVSAEAAAEIVDGSRIAVLVSCYNEEMSIAKVVTDFRSALPGASIYVYDSNSTDRTIAAAAQAGALVRREQPGQGPGGAAHVHRHRCRHLCAGGRRRHLRCAKRAR